MQPVLAFGTSQSIRVPQCASVVPTVHASTLRLLLPQLLLPSQHARLIPSLLRLRHHPLALIRARHRRPRQNILRLDLENPPRRPDRPVKIFLRVVCLRQTMQCVRKFRIKRNRALVFRNRLVQLPLTEEINPGVVMVFSACSVHHGSLIAPALILPSASSALPRIWSAAARRRFVAARLASPLLRCPRHRNRVRRLSPASSSRPTDACAGGAQTARGKPRPMKARASSRTPYPCGLLFPFSLFPFPISAARC